MDDQRLWAPWRLGYVRGEAPASPQPLPAEQLLAGGQPDCFLCQAAAAGASGEETGGEGPHRDWLVVHRGPQTVTVLNRFPYNNGHLLIAPSLHKGRPDELSDAEHLELGQTIVRMTGLIERKMQAEGFNVGLNLGHVAGAGLPGHLHWHVVPRWSGDTNFMPTTAGARVISQSLEALWDALVEK